ncbi:uncharacterized protein LOC128984133 [Macrosteles quadrilineatus]|uniref:uncharacterized protein LOC128984133 n=1 Tax=Macrosteles quadrilineatus TaxID=74068 RepID=UPI0023E0DEF5|nr:uncharacterized protein LOC128984133 [Macrosteles quadrilineatus]
MDSSHVMRQHFLSLKRQYRNSIKAAKSSKVLDIINKSANKTKTVWEIVNENRGLRKPSSHIFNIKDESVIDRVVNALDKGASASGVFFDLRKAFDMVSHDLLLEKLDNIGVRGVTNSWLSSYLRGRRFKAESEEAMRYRMSDTLDDNTTPDQQNK